jgi:sugar phosphate permease
MVAMLTAGAMINFVDRVNISVAGPKIMAALDWNEAKFGVILSAFLAGYTIFQFPGGIIADRWNAKRVVALSCLGFSVFTALTPLGGLAFGLMVALRFAVGMFESASFPAYASINSQWMPRRQYGRAQMVSLSGSYLGQMFAYPLTAYIVLTFSWPIVFYFNALLGILWMIVWLWFAASRPREHSSVSEAELAEIEQGRETLPKAAVSPWSVLRSPQVILLSLSYMCLVYGVWMIALWLPTYLVKARGFTVHQMGFVGIIPTAASFIGLVSGGMLTDAMIGRNVPARFARVQGPALLIALAVPFLVLAVLVPSSAVCVAGFAIYLLLISMATGGYWAVPLEMNARAVGAISGVMTAAGNLGGIFGPASAGYIFTATGKWSLPFLAAAAFAFIGFLIFYFLVRPEPISLENKINQPAPAAAGS